MHSNQRPFPNAVASVGGGDASPVRGLGLVVLWTLFLLGSVYFIVGSGEPLEWANAAVPTMLLVVLPLAAYLVVSRVPVMVWSPLPWFFLACAAYFGVGPLIYSYGPEEEISYVSQYYSITPLELLRSNILNVVGLLSVVYGYWLASQILPRTVTEQHVPDMRRLRRVTVLFLLIGLPSRFLLELPYALGRLPFVLPGTAIYLSAFSKLAMIPMFVLIARGERRWLPILATIAILESVVSIVMFSKLEILMTSVVLLLGAHLVYPRRRLLLLGSAAAVGAYLIAAPLVTYGREESRGYHLSATARLEIVREYFTRDHEQRKGDAHVWARLNYANAQAYAMSAYDRGDGGNTFSGIPYTFVPRFLWPQKPIFKTGGQFNFLVTGSWTSFSAPGIFAEAYWNGGWLGVLVTCVFVGILMAGATRYSTMKVGTMDLLFLPIVFFLMKVGLRPDDWFVTTYIGGPVIAVCLHFGLSLTKPFIFR
jgi:hypothetical protein